MTTNDDWRTIAGGGPDTGAGTGGGMGGSTGSGPEYDIGGVGGIPDGGNDLSAGKSADMGGSTGGGGDTRAADSGAAGSTTDTGS